MNPEDIIINQEFRDLIPPLSASELENLHVSLEASGCRDALLVWRKRGILLDGHNRLEHCRAKGIPFQIKEISCSSEDSARNFIILNQLGRRNLAPDAAAILRGKLYQSRKKEGGAPSGNKNAEKQQGNSCPVESRSTAEAVASETGVSPRTVKNDAAFAKAADAIGATKAIMAGKEKRSRKAIIAEAAKTKPDKPTVEPPARAQSLRDRVLSDLTKLLRKYTTEEQADVRRFIFEGLE